MFLDILTKYKSNIHNIFNKLREVILIIAIYFLLSIKPKYNNICTHESLIEILKSTEDLMYDEMKINGWINKNNLYEYEMEGNISEKIIIYGNIIDKRYFDILISSYVYYRPLHIILHNKKKIKGSFLELNVKFSEESHYRPSFFKNLQPNSDIYYLVTQFFKTKFSYKIQDFLFNKFYKNVNFIDLEIGYERSEIIKFLYFLNTISNLDSHSLGNYYYIPINDKCISILEFIPFIALLMLYLALESINNENYNCVDLWCVYLLFPCWCFFYINRSGYQLLCLLFYFFCINFKFGIVFGILILLKCLIVSILERIGAINKIKQ